MAEYEFKFIFDSDFVDFLATDSVGQTETREAFAFDESNLGKLTVNDKENGIGESFVGTNDQTISEIEYPNGVVVEHGGSNKANFDIDRAVTVSWEEDGETVENTFYVITGDGSSKAGLDGTPFVTWVEGTPLPPVDDGGEPPVATVITIESIDTNVEVFEGPLYDNLICFTRGTMILTERGELAVEALRADDMVVTRDRGLQPVRWIGSRSVKAEGAAAPILIKAGALANDRDLLVSPNHRMLVEGWKAEALFGETEVLATARQLTVRDDVHVLEGGEVEYFHILFDRHEIITANGAPSESLNPGEAAKGALAEEARAEVLRLFPELESVGEVALVRPMVKDGEATLLS